MDDTGKKDFKTWLKHNWIYKIAAIVMALLLWAYVMVNQNPLSEAVFTLPIEMRNLSSEYALTEQNYQVQVRVEGASGILDNLYARDFTAYVDFTDCLPGEATLNVSLDLPDKVNLVSMSPQTITVNIEEVVGSNFDVDVELNGEPAEGYTCLKPILNPSVVSLSASDEYMSQIDSVKVRLDVSQIDESFNKNISLDVYDKNGNVITQWFNIQPAAINVLVPVVADLPSKSVAVMANYRGSPADNYHVSRVIVEPETVKAFSDNSTLNSLYYINTEEVDISGRTEDYTATVKLITPDDVTLDTQSVSIIIKIEAIERKTITVDKISVKNVGEKLTATTHGGSFQVVVQGSKETISDLKAEDISLSVDCSGLTGGLHKLDVDVHLPAGIELVSVSPKETNVTITSTE